MNTLRVMAVVLVVAGAAALMYGQFSYTKETHTANLGALELSVDEKETVHIPQWAGAGAIGLGLGLLLVSLRRR